MKSHRWLVADGQGFGGKGEEEKRKLMGNFVVSY